MDDATISARLEALREQQYPLTITKEDADALVACISIIMSEVPEDCQVLVRGHYALATSALQHPSPTTSERD